VRGKDRGTVGPLGVITRKAVGKRRFCLKVLSLETRANAYP